MKPFIKWAGGKTQLLAHLAAHVPPTFGRYVEPFAGGAALFFYLSTVRSFEKAVLNEWNDELVLTYEAVKRHPGALIRALEQHEAAYKLAPERTYYGVRDQVPEEMGDVERAARFIFLNKAGFNGLYRVNKAGRFNVPWSKKETVVTFEEKNLRDCSAALRRAEIIEGDFEHVMQDATEGDVIYLDPPYMPISETSNFTAYTKKGFTFEDQERLAKAALVAAVRGAVVIASNADHPEIRKLYEERGFEVHEVLARRNVNSVADRRGKIGELIFVRKPKGA